LFPIVAPGLQRVSASRRRGEGEVVALSRLAQQSRRDQRRFGFGR
jgi:hypothetical protein